MKKAIKIAALMLVLVIVVGAFASCRSTFGSIKSNFEDNGYELKSSESTEIDTDDGKITITVHTFQYKSEGILGAIAGVLSTAVVWEFGSDADMAKAIESNKTLSEHIENAQDSDYVKGNCVLTTFNPDAVKIFKGEK